MHPKATGMPTGKRRDHALARGAVAEADCGAFDFATDQKVRPRPETPTLTDGRLATVVARGRPSKARPPNSRRYSRRSFLAFQGRVPTERAPTCSASAVHRLPRATRLTRL